MSSAGKAFPVDTSPTKDVVVDGLTRDASVEACILHILMQFSDAVDAAHEDAKRTRGKTPDNYARGTEIVLKLERNRPSYQRQLRRDFCCSIAGRSAPIWKAVGARPWHRSLRRCGSIGLFSNRVTKRS